MALASAPNKRPAAVIGVVTNTEQTEFFLIKRRDVPIWVFPGGGIERGEQPEQAVIREVQEETGLHVEIKRLVAIYEPTNALATRTYLYECRSIGGTPSNGDETAAWGYFATDAFPQNFFIPHKIWLNDLLQNSAVVLQKPVPGVTYRRLLYYILSHPLWVLRFILSRLGYPINS